MLSNKTLGEENNTFDAGSYNGSNQSRKKKPLLQLNSS